MARSVNLEFDVVGWKLDPGFEMILKMDNSMQHLVSSI
jgi:hypothetical protein